MKKTLLVGLLLILISAGLYADTSWSWSAESGFNNATASTPVSLNTQSTIQAEIGFTTSAVAENENGYKNISNYTPVGDSGVVLSAFDSNTGKAWNNSAYITAQSGIIKPETETKLYATWLLQSGQKLNIYLYADGALKLSGNDAESIGWKVSSKSGESEVIYIDCTTGATETGISVDKPSSFSEPYIEQHDATPTTTSNSDDFKNYGSVELIVQTDSVWEHPAGSYKANLNMVIEVVQ